VDFVAISTFAAVHAKAHDPYDPENDYTNRRNVCRIVMFFPTLLNCTIIALAPISRGGAVTVDATMLIDSFCSIFSFVCASLVVRSLPFFGICPIFVSRFPFVLANTQVAWLTDIRTLVFVFGKHQLSIVDTLSGSPETAAGVYTLASFLRLEACRAPTIHCRGSGCYCWHGCRCDGAWCLGGRFCRCLGRGDRRLGSSRVGRLCCADLTNHHK